MRPTPVGRGLQAGHDPRSAAGDLQEDKRRSRGDLGLVSPHDPLPGPEKPVEEVGVVTAVEPEPLRARASSSPTVESGSRTLVVAPYDISVPLGRRPRSKNRPRTTQACPLCKRGI